MILHFTTLNNMNNLRSEAFKGKNNPRFGHSPYENKTNEEIQEIKDKISTSMKNRKLGKEKRKQVKCIETTEAWLSLTDFAKEKGFSLAYASGILKRGIYKGYHYKFII